MSNNYYDVTTWPIGNASEDVGEVINSIIADIKARQTVTDENDGGKPGAVIYLPPGGDYRLRTQVVIDVSFLKIQGSGGHGFTSSSIRFNVPEEEWPDLHELWPGGSRVIVDIPLSDDSPGKDESKGAAFYIERSGSPPESAQWNSPTSASMGCTSPPRMVQGCLQRTATSTARPASMWQVPMTPSG